jgi:transmembrane sensor
MVKERFIALIDRYLSGTVTESEQQLVEEYLKRMEAGDDAMVPGEAYIKEAMWQQIQAQKTAGPAPVVPVAWYKRRGVRLMAVAACIAGLLGVGLLVFNNYDHKPVDQPVAAMKRKPDSIPSLDRHVVNTSGKEEKIQLPDGSLVLLANNSEITYKDPFIEKRDVALTGKAKFKVVKNPAKPFKVISGAISTTALGTLFLVTAYAKASQLKVRLYEGKVVVKAVDKGDKRMQKDFYLLPGQEFIYSDQAVARVRNYNYKDITTEGNANDEIAGEALSMPPNAKESWYMFNNQSLGLVFNQLAELYDVKIVYNKADVKKKYFVGRFNKSDSLDIILKYITTANRLTFSKKDNVYYINK